MSTSMLLAKTSACQTFIPSDEFNSRAMPMLSIFLDGRRSDLSGIVVFLHTSEQTMLPSSTSLYGSTFILPLINDFDESKVKFMFYETQVSVVEVLPKEGLPCSPSGSMDLRQCIEAKFEEEYNCLLPWNKDKGALVGKRVCSTLEDRQKFRYFINKVNLVPMAEAIYNMTGCHYKCKYQVRFKELLTI